MVPGRARAKAREGAKQLVVSNSPMSSRASDLWHLYPLRCSFSLLALDRDAAAVPGHDSLGEEQNPVGRSFTLAGNLEERIEQVGKPICWDTFSSISNLQDSLTISAGAGDDCLSCCIDGSRRVAQQISEIHAELSGVPFERGQKQQLQAKIRSAKRRVG